MLKKEQLKTSVQNIEEFLTKTGFILEMEVAELLAKKGYSVGVNKYFHDYDEDKNREIDIIATKKVGEVLLVLVIECKQSLIDDWIFICSDKRPSRYYQYLKHTPEAIDNSKTKIFNHFSVLDYSSQLAQNHIIRGKSKKKSTSMQIDTCLEKLPKALVDFVDSNKEINVRKIYLPVAVFSGNIFTAQYSKKLQVKNTEWVQHESFFESENYLHHYESSLFLMKSPYEISPPEKSKPNSAIAHTSQNIGYKYLIDFTTKKGLSKLILRVEADISKIDLTKWPIQEKK